jgi:hypothetical protein
LKICSISRNPRGALAVSLMTVAVAFAARGTCQVVEPTAAPALGSRVVATFRLGPESRPQWARFSPVNPHLALIDLGGQGLLLSIPQGTTRRIDKGLSPVGWLGETLVVRDQRGGLRLLDGGTLTPPANASVGLLPLPWTFGKDRLMRFQMALPETSTTGITLTRAAGGDRGVVTAREEQSPVAVAPDGAGRNLVDAGGRVVFRGDRKIYGISASPDGYKILVYYGNTEYLLFNRLTGRTTRLPPIIHAWTWLPDSNTLLGDVSLSGQPSREEVTSTELYIYEPEGARLTRIVLPPSLRGVALKILDISAEGYILVEAERVVPEPAYLGLTVVEVLW